MSRAYGSPSKYIQKSGEINNLSKHIESLGSQYLLLVDPVVIDRFKEATKSISNLLITAFNGECSQKEIDRVIALAKEHKVDVIIGAGGGKCLDTSKIAAVNTHSRILIIPTIASTDAPCSAVAVRYSEEGVYEESLKLPQNPDVVLVDPELIIAAPIRFLISGIGDALSTWFEARSNIESRTPNYVAGGYPPTEVAIAIARRCHDILMEDAHKAVVAAKSGLITPAVEKIIEANILMSGVGFENCGCSAAHGIHDGLTVLPKTHHLLHGEKVAFGTLCLLMLENRDAEEITAMIQFCRSLKLPVTLEDLGLGDASKEDLTQVAEASLEPDGPIHATPVELTVRSVRDAILALDAFAKEVV